MEPKPKSVSIDVDEDEAKKPSEGGPGLGSTIVDMDGPLAAGAAKNHGVVDEDVSLLDSLPDHAIVNADGSVTLPLQFPQSLQVRKAGKVRTDTYDSLTFHRLTGADQKAIFSTSEEMQAVVAFARSTRLNQAIMNALFDKLDLSDITAGGRVLNSFIATGRKTGR